MPFLCKHWNVKERSSVCKGAMFVWLVASLLLVSSLVAKVFFRSCRWRSLYRNWLMTIKPFLLTTPSHGITWKALYPHKDGTLWDTTVREGKRRLCPQIWPLITIFAQIADHHTKHSCNKHIAFLSEKSMIDNIWQWTNLTMFAKDA